MCISLGNQRLTGYHKDLNVQFEVYLPLSHTIIVGQLDLLIIRKGLEERCCGQIAGSIPSFSCKTDKNHKKLSKNDRCSGYDSTGSPTPLITVRSISASASILSPFEVTQLIVFQFQL
jgi:hypothetical protein